MIEKDKKTNSGTMVYSEQLFRFLLIDICPESLEAYAKIYIDDSAFGCPLVPGDKGTRSMLDWEVVREVICYGTQANAKTLVFCWPMHMIAGLFYVQFTGSGETDPDGIKT